MLGTMEERTSGMKRQAQELIEQAYQRGYKAGYQFQTDANLVLFNNGMEQGRKEAWEAAYKLVFNQGNIRDAFDTESLGAIFEKCSAAEAIEKLKKYEEQKKQEEIHVGDEIILNDIIPNTDYLSCEPAIVIIADEDSCRYPYHVMLGNGKTKWINKDAINRKTGRHFPEIAEVLKKMQEDTNESKTN